MTTKTTLLRQHFTVPADALLADMVIRDVPNEDIMENTAAAAVQGGQPLLVWHDAKLQVVGHRPSFGLADALRFALQRPSTRVGDFVSSRAGLSLKNASNKFKQLLQHGYLLRHERAAATGGVEYVCDRIGKVLCPLVYRIHRNRG